MLRCPEASVQKPKAGVHEPKEYAGGVPYIERSRNSIVLVQINQLRHTAGKIAKGGTNGRVLHQLCLRNELYRAKRQDSLRNLVTNAQRCTVQSICQSSIVECSNLQSLKLLIYIDGRFQSTSNVDALATIDVD